MRSCRNSRVLATHSRSSLGLDGCRLTRKWSRRRERRTAAHFQRVRPLNDERNKTNEREEPDGLPQAVGRRAIGDSRRPFTVERSGLWPGPRTWRTILDRDQLVMRPPSVRPNGAGCVSLGPSSVVSRSVGPPRPSELARATTTLMPSFTRNCGKAIRGLTCAGADAASRP